MTVKATIPAMRMAALNAYQITMDPSVLCSVHHGLVGTAAMLMERDCVRMATIVHCVMFTVWAEMMVWGTTSAVRMGA